MLNRLVPPGSAMNYYVACSYGAVIAMAYDEITRHESFFVAATTLNGSNVFQLALANAVFVSIYALGRLCSWIFLGTVMAHEQRSASDQLFAALFDFMLCMSMSHVAFDDFVHVGVALMVRVLHHLARARLESIEQSLVVPSRLGLVRFACMLWTFLVVDLTFAGYCWSRHTGIFGLLTAEYVVRALENFSTTSRLLIQQYDNSRGNHWYYRGTIRFYSDTIFETLICVCFIAIVSQSTGIFHVPLIRVALYNGSRVVTLLKNFNTYRKLNGRLARFGEPTPEQLGNDPVCSVCLEEITGATAGHAKRLPCSHCFHWLCLQRWFENHDNCPYCRQPVEAMLQRATEQEQVAAANNAAHQPAEGAAAPVVERVVVEAVIREDVLRNVYEQYLELHKQQQIALGHRQPPPAPPHAEAAQNHAPRERHPLATEHSHPVPASSEAAATDYGRNRHDSSSRLTSADLRRLHRFDIPDARRAAPAAATSEADSDPRSLTSKLESYRRFAQRVREATEALEIELAEFDDAINE